MMIAEATKKVVERQDLTAAEAEQVMDEIMSGKGRSCEYGSFPDSTSYEGGDSRRDYSFLQRA